MLLLTAVPARRAARTMKAWLRNLDIVGGVYRLDCARAGIRGQCAFIELLARATSCVVTIAEDDRLRRVDKQHLGWARYTNAKMRIRVWDRLLQCWD